MSAVRSSVFSIVCVAVSARLAVLPEAQSPAPVRDRQVDGTEPVPAAMGHLSVVDRSVVTSATPSPTVESSTVVYGSPVSVLLLT